MAVDTTARADWRDLCAAPQTFKRPWLRLEVAVDDLGREGSESYLLASFQSRDTVGLTPRARAHIINVGWYLTRLDASLASEPDPLQAPI